jgi:1,2-diacylglycerol 3-alpha-glucosyltransferase
MRILHLCLSNFYVDGFSYQENELVQQNVKDGHVVEVIASTEVVRTDGSLAHVPTGRYLGTDGAMVERVEYRRLAPHRVMAKLRMHPGIYSRIEAFKPDVILFHCACGWEIRTAARYVRAHPHVRLYIDSHEDFVNSARGWVSKWLLHYGFYRPILRSALDVVSKILPVSISCMEFIRDFYGVPQHQLEYFPLGGTVPDDREYDTARQKMRQTLGLADGDVLIVQSGKIDATKKLVEAVEAFAQVKDPALRFVVPGVIQADVAGRVQEIVEADQRIHLLGWKSSADLRALLCAADVYCQPGTQSATMQMSIANRCVIILDDVASHKPYLDGNGWLIGMDQTLLGAFRAISENKPALAEMQLRSHALALRMLDYRQLAKRIYR